MTWRRDTFVLECLLRLRPGNVVIAGESPLAARWAQAANAPSALNATPCRVIGTADWPQGTRADVAILDPRERPFQQAAAAIDDATYVIVLLAHFDALLEPWEHLNLVAACWPTPSEPGAIILSRNDPAGLTRIGPGLDAGEPHLDPIASRRQLLEDTRATAHAQAAALSAIRGSLAYRFARHVAQHSLTFALDRLLHPERRWTTIRIRSGELILLSLRETPDHPAMPWDFVHTTGSWLVSNSVTIPRPLHGTQGQLRFTAPAPMIIALAHPAGGEIEIITQGPGRPDNLPPRTISLREPSPRAVVLQPWSNPAK